MNISYPRQANSSYPSHLRASKTSLTKHLLLILGFVVLLNSAILSQPIRANTDSSDRQNLPHQRYGNYSEFGDPLYGLKLETLNNHSSSSELLDSNEDKILSMRILAETLGPRRWCRFWTQNIAINISSEALEAITDPILDMCDAIKANLVKGDHIQFLRQDSQTTQLRLNGTELLEMKGEGIFESILSPFLGRSPVSGELKANLLTNRSANSVSATIYRATEVSLERRQETANWVAAVNPAITTSAPSGSYLANNSNQASEFAGQPALDFLTLSKSNSLEISISTERLISALDTNLLSNGLEETKDWSTEFYKTPGSRDTNGLSMVAFNRSGTASAEGESSIRLLKPVLTAISPAEIQEYQRQSLAKVYDGLSYPGLAQRRGLEGSIRLSVSIDREGQIADVKPLELSPFDSLNEAAQTAVLAAGPFAAPPLQPDESHFDLILPIRFVLE